MGSNNREMVPKSEEHPTDRPPGVLLWGRVGAEVSARSQPAPSVRSEDRSQRRVRQVVTPLPVALTPPGFHPDGRSRCFSVFRSPLSVHLSNAGAKKTCAELFGFSFFLAQCKKAPWMGRLFRKAERAL